MNEKQIIERLEALVGRMRSMQPGQTEFNLGALSGALAELASLALELLEARTEHARAVDGLMHRGAGSMSGALREEQEPSRIGTAKTSTVMATLDNDSRPASMTIDPGYVAMESDDQRIWTPCPQVAEGAFLVSKRYAKAVPAPRMTLAQGDGDNGA